MGNTTTDKIDILSQCNLESLINKQRIQFIVRIRKSNPFTLSFVDSDISSV